MSTPQLSLLDGGAPERDASLSQWHTPPKLAAKITRWCGDVLNGARVLEPSAGGGVFLDGLSGKTCARATAHELAPHWAQYLRERHPLATIIEGDYLAAPAPDRPYDIALMNPPFEGGLDGKFIAKAMDDCLRVVAVIREHAKNGVKRHKQVWSRIGGPEGWVCTGTAHLVRRPKFGGPNGQSGGPEHEFCVVKMSRVPGATVAGEEWWEL